VTGQHYEQVYYAFMELEVPLFARIFYQVRAHPHGRKLFRDKPDVLAVLCDDAYLASLPAGSLGHAYRSFLDTNHLHAGVFDQVDVIRPLAEKRNWSEEFYWFMVRCTALHDMFHTIGGYGPDIAGEIINFGFQVGQLEPAGSLKTLGFLMSSLLPGASLRHKMRVYGEALERGRRADQLFAAPWEELIDKPIDDVRALLGVAPTKQSHPRGLWYTPIRPIGVAAPTYWDYEEILDTER
jgi:ubiquinone biosynthesis protein COQ4